MNERQLTDARNTLQALVSTLGRDDFGVGEVSEEGGVVTFILTKGHFTHTDQIPVALLADKQQALARLNGIVMKLSKEIEREQIEQATQTSG